MLSDHQETCFFIQPRGLRPDFRLLFPFIFGEDSPNVDTDGNSHNPASREWTELYCQNRSNEQEIFDIDPVLEHPLTLKIASRIPELAARVAYFMASATGSLVGSGADGPWHELDWLRAKVGDFDLDRAFQRVAASRWQKATLENPYAK